MSESVVLVTGGAGNVGRAVTRAFLEGGDRVAVPFYKTDVPSALDELRNEFGDRLHVFALDLTTERGAEQAVREVIEWAGRLDFVAHLVGGYSGGVGIADTPVEALDRMIDLNLKSAWLVVRFAAPAMERAGGGSFVFVGSRAARKDRAGRAAYAVSKAALLAFSEAVAEEYGGRGIRANAILPDTIDTPANRKAMPDADHARWTRPEEVARVIRYLASAESRPVNGAVLPV